MVTFSSSLAKNGAIMVTTCNVFFNVRNPMVLHHRIMHVVTIIAPFFAKCMILKWFHANKSYVKELAPLRRILGHETISTSSIQIVHWLSVGRN